MWLDQIQQVWCDPGGAVESLTEELVSPAPDLQFHVPEDESLKKEQ